MSILDINKKLKELYGRDDHGQAVFRVVWSDSLIEKRFGTFKDFVPGTNIFLREVTEVRQVKKYAYHPKQFILEKLMLNQHGNEILESDTAQVAAYVYEPLWCFGHEDAEKTKPHHPNWRAVQLLIGWYLNPEKVTPSQVNDKEFKELEKDEAAMLEMLNAALPIPLSSSIRDGDSVIVSNTDMWTRNIKKEISSGFNKIELDKVVK